jgi:flagellar biosynthesis protein FlhB
MADAEDQEQRTEEPSGKRISDAYAEGQVPMGHDLVLAAGSAAGWVALIAIAGLLRDAITAMFHQAAASVAETPFRGLAGLAARPVVLTLIVAAAAAFAIGLATVVQTKGGFWLERVAPDPARLASGFGNLKRIFSKDFGVDLLLNVAKVTAISAAAYTVLRGEVFRFSALLTAEPVAQVGTAFGALARAAKPVLAVLAVLAAAEWWVQRHRFMKQMKMTKEEAKREAKEQEGDPLIRGQRRRRHRELLRNQARTEVPRADALVVNPTHVAVAIRYRRDEGKAPRVTAKGKGELAEYMRNLARENGVPICEDIPLARLLYRKVKVGREIPAQTYKAVAAILAFVYRVTKKAPGARA